MYECGVSVWAVIVVFVLVQNKSAGKWTICKFIQIIEENKQTKQAPIHHIHINAHFDIAARIEKNDWVGVKTHQMQKQR